PASSELYTLSLHDALPILEQVKLLPFFFGNFMTIFAAECDALLRYAATFFVEVFALARAEGGEEGVEVFVAFVDPVILTAEAMTDRKSTRLNSSHVKISYA